MEVESDLLPLLFAADSRHKKELEEVGYTTLRGLLHEDRRLSLLSSFADAELEDVADVAFVEGSPGRHVPRVVNMSAMQFGEGDYAYLREPLPPPFESLREELYSALAPIANELVQQHIRDVAPRELRVQAYPATLNEFHELCRAQSRPQTMPTCIVLRYGEGGQSLPHRDLAGTATFPFQALCLLSAPDQDFFGGSFFLQADKTSNDTRARPRLEAGDVLVFRSSLYHGIEPVTRGKRIAVGLQFALTNLVESPSRPRAP